VRGAAARRVWLTVPRPLRHASCHVFGVLNVRRGAVAAVVPWRGVVSMDEHRRDPRLTSPHSILLTNTRRSSKVGGSLHWDEGIIAEHDKERGTRTRILEPKTPYHSGRSLDDSGSEGGMEDTYSAAPQLDKPSAGVCGRPLCQRRLHCNWRGVTY
jgi:hypothetical protein